MNYSDYKFTLDVQIHQAQVSVPVSLNDTARKLCIGLTDGRKPYTIADGCIASFVAKKPDGTILHNNCIIERNTIVYEFTPQTTNVEGIVNCEIRLQKNNVLLVSPQFLIVVDKQVVRADEIVVSEDEVNTIGAIIAEESRRMQAESTRAEAEAARGSREEYRIDEEKKRAANEDQRKEYEYVRQEKENERLTNEANRKAAEQDRADAEEVRAEEERERRIAELERKANERSRQEAIRDVGTALDNLIALQNALINKEVG